MVVSKLSMVQLIMSSYKTEIVYPKCKEDKQLVWMSFMCALRKCFIVHWMLQVTGAAVWGTVTCWVAGWAGAGMVGMGTS